jgi:Protein of unknown function (DUF3592)
LLTYTALMTLLGSRITYFLLIGIGAILGAYFVYLDRQDEAIRTTYQQTTCTITSAEVSVEEEMHHTRGRHYVTRTYYPEIVYTFKVDGQQFEGEDYRAFEHGMTEEEANVVVARYSEGHSATCYYDPADPENAVLTLESDRSGMYSLATCGLVFLVGGLVGWAVIDFVLPSLDQSAKAAKKTPDDFKVEIPEWPSVPRT